MCGCLLMILSILLFLIGGSYILTFLFTLSFGTIPFILVGGFYLLIIYIGAKFIKFLLTDLFK